MSKYEQYKLDTKRFIIWLAVTARAFGHNIRDPAAVPRDVSKNQPSIRLKCNARVKARKEAANAPAASIATLSASKTKYPMSTERILELAEYIGNQKMMATMPKFIWFSYRRAIRTRETFAARYASDELTDKESDDGHIYFLWVLKRCSEIFENNLKVLSTARPATANASNARGSSSSLFQPITVSVATPTPQMTDASTTITPEEAEAAEAEREAVGHELDRLARKLELDMKTKAEEELAMQKSCLTDDMRKTVEQLEVDWEDTHKDLTLEDHLGEVQATLMTEAALDLIRHQEEVLVRKAEEKGLKVFDASLVTDGFFGKTARSLTKFESYRKKRGEGYMFLVSGLNAQEIASGDYHSNSEHEFLAHYIQEASLEVTVKERFGTQFKLPLLNETLDTPSRLYASLGTKRSCSMSLVFAAELARRIRSKDTAHSLRRYLPLVQKNTKHEKQLLEWTKDGVRFAPFIRDVAESDRTIRAFIIDRPFSKIRHTEMRLLGTVHPLCGMHHDYPDPKFRNESSKKAYLAALAEKKVPDELGYAAGRKALYAGYVPPPQDGEFLRMSIPTLRAKLSLVESLLYEEMGIGFANASPQIFAVCHLLNCFLRNGLVEGSWPELETMMDWHLGKIFLGNTPEKPDQFFSRMLSASGYSAGAIAKYRDLKRNPDLDFASGKATHKTCELEPLAITKILRDYVHSKETGLRIWYRLDEEMSKASGVSSQTQENGDPNILSFVKKLRDSEQLRHLLTRLEFDYIGLTLQCNEICHKIDVAQKTLVGQPAKEEAHWKSPTDCGCSIVSTILGEMDRFYQLKKQGGKKAKDVQDNNTVVVGAVKVVQEFLDELQRVKV